MKTIFKSAASILLLIFTVGLNTPALADGNTYPIEHIVIVWLKDPGNAEHRNRILSESEILKDIPGVLSLKSGSVITSDRSIVDSSFDVALIVSFEDQATLDSYVIHPTHIKLLEETLKPLVQKIQVYDFK